MPLDPVMARGIAPLGAGLADTMLAIANLQRQDRNSQQFAERTAIMDRADQRDAENVQMQQRMREKLAEVEMLDGAPVELQQAYLAQQQAQDGQFANTPFAKMPPAEAIKAMKRGLQVKLGMQPTQPEKVPGPITEQRLGSGRYQLMQDGNPVGTPWAPPQPAQGPAGSWSAPFDGIGEDGKPGKFTQHSITGQVRPVGVAPIPKETAAQGPKNVKDAGLAQSRINASRVAMQELEGALGALNQSKLFGTGPIAGRMGALSAPVQRFDAAVKRLFGHMQAITRIPGIGQQSDWEGRMQLLTLPSSEYDEGVNATAIQELKTFLQDVESAYRTAFGESMPGRGASGSWSDDSGWSAEETK